MARAVLLNDLLNGETLEPRLCRNFAAAPSARQTGGVLMAGWTVLLLWAVRRPFERRFVILQTRRNLEYLRQTQSLLGL